jgi:hypothetical protein
MTAQDDIRPNEIAVEWPDQVDAGLAFIGVIRTPWPSRADCPHHGRPDGPICQIEVSPPWDAALDGIEAIERLEVFYWLHQARRDLVRQSPGRDGLTKGTFTIRSFSRDAYRPGRRRPARAGPRLRRPHAPPRPQARPFALPVR